MFTVTGMIGSVGYRVGVHPEGVDDPSALGVAMGSENAIALLRLNEGTQVQATPTSEPVVLDTKNADTILAFLHGATDVSDVSGDDVPNIFGPGEPGTVY